MRLRVTKPEVSVTQKEGCDVINCDFSIVIDNNKIPTRVEITRDMELNRKRDNVAVYVHGEEIFHRKVYFKLSTEDMVREIKCMGIEVVDQHAFYEYSEYSTTIKDSWIILTRRLGTVFLRGFILNVMSTELPKNYINGNKGIYIPIMAITKDDVSLVPSALLRFVGKVITKWE